MNWRWDSISATIADMRYLGVDLGTKRIGLALADPDTGVASPIRIIQALVGVQQNAQAIMDVADQYGAKGIVIGMPLNMDGTEGPQAKQSKALAAAIAKFEGITVHLHDERLTSHAADIRLIDRDLTRKKKKARQDAIAAQILLESFLDSRGC